MQRGIPRTHVPGQGPDIMGQWTDDVPNRIVGSTWTALQPDGTPDDEIKVIGVIFGPEGAVEFAVQPTAFGAVESCTPESLLENYTAAAGSEFAAYVANTGRTG